MLPTLESLQTTGTWTLVRPPVSQSTDPSGRGDWSSYPHLTSKDTWKQLMGVRAREFGNFLAQHNIWVNSCLVCSEHGHGMRSDFEGHVTGQCHFKDLGRCRLADAIPVCHARLRMWDSFNVPGGSIRFNHADGAIEMCRGPLSSSDWKRIGPYMGGPTTPDGDFRTVEHLLSKDAFARAVLEPSRRVDELLAGHNMAQTHCMICKRLVGSMKEHLASERHFAELSVHFSDGISIAKVAKNLWQEWEAANGSTRFQFNHMHGAIDIRENDGSKVPCASLSPSSSSSMAPGPHMAAAASTKPATPFPHNDGKLNPSMLPNDGEWYQLHPPASVAIKENGDWRAYPCLASRHAFKAAMSEPARIVCNILENQRPPIWPECEICDRARCFQEHVPAIKHYNCLYTKFLMEGSPVQSIRERLWQEWVIPGGNLRINYIDGEVQMANRQNQPLSLPGPFGAPPLPPLRDFSMELSRPPSRLPEMGVRLQQYPSEPHAEPPPLSFTSPPGLPGFACSPAPTEGIAAMNELGLWLWRDRSRVFAERLEREFTTSGMSLDSCTCSVCDHRPMREGVACHLLSVAHVQRVLEQSGHARIASDSLDTLQCIVQVFDFPDGRKLSINHCPLKLVQPEDSYRGGGEAAMQLRNVAGHGGPTSNYERI